MMVDWELNHLNHPTSPNFDGGLNGLSFSTCVDRGLIVG